MIPTGWLIDLFNGSIKAWNICKEKRETEEELEKVLTRDALFDGLQGVDLITAQNNLLLAEYLVKRAKMQGRINRRKRVSLWKKVKETMNANLAAVETQLRRQPASKLDVAKILTALNQMAGETDQEITNLREELTVSRELSEKVQLMESSWRWQGPKISEQAAIILNLQERIGRRIGELESRNAKHTAEIEAVKKSTAAEIEKLQMNSLTQKAAWDAAERKINEAVEKLKTQSSALFNEVEALSASIESLHDLTLDEIKRVKTLISEQEERLTDQLDNDRQRTKMMVIPLYVIVALLALKIVLL